MKKSVDKNDFLKFKNDFEKNGYYFNNAESLVAAYLANKYYDLPRKGLSGILLTGEPGVGKTHFAESLAKVTDAELLEYQCVASTTDEHLYATINTVGLVNKTNPVSDGILVRAINNANNGKKTVLLIDEIDKGNENIDPYFLTFFQKGEIWTPDHGVVKVKDDCRDNLIVVVCKNKWRDLDGSLLRRLRRIELELPDVQTMSRIIEFNNNGFNESMKSIALKLYGEILGAPKGTFSRIVSAQEVINALNDDIIIENIGGNARDRILNLVSWYANTPEDRKELKEIFSDYNKFCYNVDETGVSSTLSKLPMLNYNEKEISEFIKKTTSLEIHLENAVIKVVRENGITVTDDNKPRVIGYIDVDGDGDIDFTIKEEVSTVLRALTDALNDDKTIPDENVYILSQNGDRYICSIRIGSINILFADSRSDYISLRQLIEAFASLYSISALDNEPCFTKAILNEDKIGVAVDIITYDDPSLVLTKGTYKKFE